MRNGLHQHALAHLVARDRPFALGQGPASPAASRQAVERSTAHALAARRPSSGTLPARHITSSHLLLIVSRTLTSLREGLPSETEPQSHSPI
ncbi:hypothetical protein CGCTS75_v009232 [Colletotrichum tropicale]|nr:hypothetical protein CGCTS75_v009232 [Colletotrichum tropicale]